MEGGIIEYTRQIKEEAIESKFIGKNFVFDARLGERITDDIVSQCHQCGKPCDNHTNCANDGCHLLFIQCDDCQAAMENCCSTECLEIIHLPVAEQVQLRKGKEVGNKVFRKGKSEALKFKNSGDLPNSALAKAKTKVNSQKIKIKKVLVAKAEHYYTKSKIAQFLIKNNELSVGDKVLISGSTTGEQTFEITQLFANGNACQTAIVGDQVTFEIPFRIRLSDQLYKILE